MKIVLLGATGFVGSALLTEALDRGHTVLAIARRPEKIAPRERLIVKAGDVYDAAALATLISGHEALISAFNPGWKNPRLYDDQVRGTAAIIAAVKQAGIRRVLWVGGAGGLEVKPGDHPAHIRQRFTVGYREEESCIEFIAALQERKGISHDERSEEHGADADSRRRLERAGLGHVRRPP